jgi:acetyl esterase/lipase
MLALWELPLWRGLWERLCASLPRDITCWNAKDRLNGMQLYQAYQAAAVERPGLLLAPSPELLAAVRKNWVDGLETDTVKTSRLHADVSSCLARMGVAHANEHWCERAERSIDIAIEGAGAPVAVEVDGPTHFLQDGRQDGSTALRNRMLAAHGWRVVVVDYRAWREQQTEAQRQEYLRHLLA